MNNLEHKKFGEAWLKFYIYWRFPIGIVLGAINLINSFISVNNSVYIDLSLFYLLSLVDIAVYIYRIVVFASMLKKTPLSYHMNTILLFVEAFYISITRALLNDSLLFLPIFLVIMGLIWVLPNIVYFRHRRYLFGIEPLESAHSSESTEAVRFQPGLSASETNISEDSSALLISSPIMEFDHDTSPKAPHDDPHLNIAVFCHKCGAKLLDGASFCRKCGTPTHHFSSINQEVTSDPSRILPHGEIAKEKVPYVENDLNNDGDTIPDHDWRIDLLDKTLPPKIRRASLYIEDGEWDNAEKTLEAVLDEDPTNAYAYIGKTLVDFRVSQTSDLVNFADTLAENKNFQKAVRFADETIAKKLLSLPLSAKIQS